MKALAVMVVGLVRAREGSKAALAKAALDAAGVRRESCLSAALRLGVSSLNLKRCWPQPMQARLRRAQREHAGFAWSHCGRGEGMLDDVVDG